MDHARQLSEKKLDSVERELGRVYKGNPALLSISKKYAKYMQWVSTQVEGAYKAYINAEDEESKAERKNAYMDEIRRYTLGSNKYNAIVREFVGVLADVNQQALNVVNDATVEVYAINYNQAAEDCEKVGIKVNGKGQGKK